MRGETGIYLNEARLVPSANRAFDVARMLELGAYMRCAACWLRARQNKQSVPVTGQGKIIMRRFCAALATSGLFASAVALSATTPLIVEESAKLVLPNTQYNTISDVAVDGDTTVVGVTRYEQRTGERWNTAYVYERALNGTWAYRTQLPERHSFAF
jgi:hypothetical protein